MPYKFQKEGNFDKANELLNDLSTNIVVDGQGQDPFWQNAAADYLTGIGLALFQDAPLDEININSVNLMINQGEERFGASTYMKEYFKMQDANSPIAINLAGTVTTADETKAGIMKYITSTHLTLYKLGNVYDYFYSLMPINTRVLSHFELTYFNENGFVLRFPTVYMKDKIKEFEPRKNIYNLYTESRNWAKRLDLVNVVDLNKKIESGKIQEIIKMDELAKNTKLMELATTIINRDKVRIIL
mgnify:CR=1 FL=1